MKECDNLQIITTSIKDFIKDVFSKDTEDLLLSEILKIESLTLSGKSPSGKKQMTSFQDLILFQNLRYLEITDTLMTSNSINILSQITYLENLIIRDCPFSNRLNNIDKLMNIKSIRIYNCTGFNPSYLSKLTNIKRIFLSKIEISNVNIFTGLNLESLDISASNIKDWTDIEKINTKNLIINHNQYLENKKKIDLCTYKIMVIATDGYYIEKWIN